MTSRTSWVAGNNSVGLTWTACFGSADLTSLASGSSILSSAAAVTNGTYLDQYIDLSLKITITSQTPSAGAQILLYLAYLNQDLTSYGDGGLSSGASAAYIPLYPYCASFNLVAAATTTLMGTQTGILIAPGSFNFVLTNSSGLSFSSTAGNNKCSWRVYNQNNND
jgi:hypothetical protein